eukprot:TRINITY_DN41836_c0_g1_i1.p1 TRINITY_DN41836_c0_g1~~TRINITY_DN41836_c0_g1_i1.p1  ORF type:complete len:504 (+),score=59.81 TRINITY_DN41836_c0_g1_i1:64-1575(+)
MLQKGTPSKTQRAAEFLRTPGRHPQGGRRSTGGAGSPLTLWSQAAHGSPIVWDQVPGSCDQGLPLPSSPISTCPSAPASGSFAPASPPAVLPLPRRSMAPATGSFAPASPVVQRPRLSQGGGGAASGKAQKSFPLALPAFPIGSPVASGTKKNRLSGHGATSWQTATPLYKSGGCRSPLSAGQGLASPVSGSCSSTTQPASGGSSSQWFASTSTKGSPCCAAVSTPVCGNLSPSSIVNSTPSRIISVSTPLRPCSRLRAKELQDDVRAAVEDQSVPLLKVALQRRHTCPNDHALHEAVRQGNSGAVRLLLQNRADPNVRCLGLEGGCLFPLQLAVCSNFIMDSERAQIVELLLKAGALTGPRRIGVEGNTPLHDSVRRRETEMVVLLLRHAADPNATNGFGEAPLELALRGIDASALEVARAMVEALLQAGACPFVVDPDRRAGPQDELLSQALLQDPEIRSLLDRCSAWWRCRVLAWIRSRGSGHPLCHMMPELLVQVAQFL